MSHAECDTPVVAQPTTTSRSRSTIHRRVDTYLQHLRLAHHDQLTSSIAIANTTDSIIHVDGIGKDVSDSGSESDNTSMGSSSSSRADVAPMSTADMQALQLCHNPSTARLPVVYSSHYNISFMGLEKLHPFDSKKYERVHQRLVDAHLLKPTDPHQPVEASPALLRVIHPVEYLKTLQSSMKVAGILEVPPVAMLPNSIVQSNALSPMRYAVAGTLLAADLAAKSVHQVPSSDSSSSSASSSSASAPSSSPSSHISSIRPGWSVNLGGGFHHCSATRGGGFCAYADISLAILYIHAKYPNIKRILVVDCDAHQGNGYARDKLDGVFNRAGIESVYILDLYNAWIYPGDHHAAQAIDHPIQLRSGATDREYLPKLRRGLSVSIEESRAQLVIYNAGTDCLVGDPLGQMNISAEGIMERDRIVFQQCLDKQIPVVMLLSGGYQKSNAEVIARSIANLKQSLNLWQNQHDHDQSSDVAPDSETDSSSKHGKKSKNKEEL